MKALPLLALLAVAGCATPTQRVRVAAPATVQAPPAPANPLVGGIAMPAERTIGANLALAPTLATLTRAVGAAGLTETLAGAGPFTVFAPADQAFGRLAPGVTETLMKSENRSSLAKLLRLHVVTGQLSSAELIQRVAAGGGRATLSSLAGEPLVVTVTGTVVTLTDAGGNKSYVEIADVRQANGVIHVVNGVLVPRID